MAGNGLEVRVPFLDFDYVEFITRINPALLMYSLDRIEKKIVRDSFRGYLPDEILYRPKEAFSDAVSSKEVVWYHAIRDSAEETISDGELVNSPYQTNKPEIKEALYYRRMFDQFYPGRDNVLPHYWLPKWVQEKDPSATVLSDKPK
jgi:asparagine synthase (glutamine-hydrolysing)